MFGIVAGLGPRATVEFYSAFMNTVTARTEGRLPRLIIYSVAMSPQIENSFLQGPVGPDAAPRRQARELLGEAVRHFLDNRVTTVAMACNTLQDELTTLCRAHGLVNLNMIDATADAIHHAGVLRVLVLGTASTYGDDLYGQRLRAHGVHCLYPDHRQQGAIETHIRVALDHKVDAADQARFEDDVRQMVRDSGADGVVLACTDLSGDLIEQDDLPVFDSLRLLAGACAEHVLQRNELFL